MWSGHSCPLKAGSINALQRQLEAARTPAKSQSHPPAELPPELSPRHQIRKFRA